MSAARQVKSDKQTKQVNGTAKRVALATQRAARGNLRLTPERGRHMVLRKDKVEIGNFRLTVLADSGMGMCESVFILCAIRDLQALFCMINCVIPGEIWRAIIRARSHAI